MAATRISTTPLVLALTFCASLAFGQETDASKTGVLDDKSAKELRDRILAEAATLPNHPWAGEYHCGDGVINRQRLFLAPESGFLIEWSGCSGLYYRNYGPVKEQDGGLKLCFSLENKGEYAGKSGLPDEYIFVDWKPCQYLVPANDLPGFRNRVSAGDDPSNTAGLYFLRGQEQGGRGTGMPEFPNGFESNLPAARVAAEIVSIDTVALRPYSGGLTYKDITVTLNAGEEQGLRKGMRMCFKRWGVQSYSVVVSAVAKGSSQAAITKPGCRDGDQDPEVEKGWRLSTQWP